MSGALNSTTHSVITVSDMVHGVRLRWKRLVLAPVLVGISALAITFALPTVFTAQTRFLPPVQQQNTASAMLQSLGGIGSLSGLAAGAAGLKNPLDQYVSIARSRTLITTLAERFEFKEKYKEDTLEGALLAFEKHARITAGKDGILTIEIDDTNPVAAAKIANEYAGQFSDLLSRISSSEARHRREFFDKQISDAKNELLKLDRALATASISLGEIRKIPNATVGALADLNNRVEVLEAKRAAYRSYMTSSAAPVTMINAEIAELKKRRDALSNNSSETHTGDYLAAYRDYKFQEMLLEMLMRQFEMAKVDEARGSGALQVIDVAVPPERKSKPRRLLIAAAAAATAFALAFVHLLIGLANEKKPESTQ